MVGEVLHKEVQHAAAGAHGPVPGAVEHPADAGVDDGPGAHGAGLQGDVQVAVLQPPGAQGIVCLGHGLHLRVGGHGLLLLPAVAAPADDGAVPDDDAAHRHLPRRGGLTGQGQGLGHKLFMHGFHGGTLL